MYELVKKSGVRCPMCQASRNYMQKTYGLLKPHEVPREFCKHGTAYFRKDRSRTKSEKGSILVIVDKFSRRAIFIPAPKAIT